jgi:hypothetical protein
MDAIDQASLDAAFARLDKKAGFKLTCPCCGHTDDVPEDPEKRLYTCDVCQTKIAYGVEQPNLAILPHADRRFVVTKIVKGKGKNLKEGVLLLERQYATQYALELLSVTLPAEKWAAVAKVLTAGAPEVVASPTRLPDPPPAPVRNPGSEPTAEPEKCQCGAPSAHRNGACAACFIRALGGG